MKTLCVNSSDALAQISVVNENEIITKTVQNPHSEFLLPKISDLLDSKNLSVNDFDNFAVVVGPGSFTGIRIAVAIIKAMAVVNEKAKLIKISNFDLVAFNQKKDINFLVVLESGNEDYYVCEYYDNKPVKTFAMNYQNLNNYALQNNLNIYANINQKEKLTNLNAKFLQIEEESLALLSLQKIKQNDFVDINNLTPIYVKLSQAERQLKEKILAETFIEKVDNADIIMPIENSCFEEVWQKETIQNDLLQDSKYYYVAKYNGEEIGYIAIECACDELSLLKIAVKESFRGYGIATKLIEYTKQLMQKHGLKKYFLEVSYKNNIAKNLYQKTGFKQISVRKNYYKNGDDCIVMLYENN